MIDRAKLKEGMPVFGAVDQFIGTVERLESSGIVVNGRRVPDDAIERVEVDRVYLSGSAARQAASEDALAAQRAQQRAAGEVRTPATQADASVPRAEITEERPGGNPQNSGLFGSTGTTGSTAMASDLPRMEAAREAFERPREEFTERP